MTIDDCDFYPRLETFAITDFEIPSTGGCPWFLIVVVASRGDAESVLCQVLMATSDIEDIPKKCFDKA